LQNHNNKIYDWNDFLNQFLKFWGEALIKEQGDKIFTEDVLKEEYNTK
jgi:hypothetical protein